ncbi:hypothetical protein [Lewinella sp. LCG006]|uniref:hypothetical protein n=1 Tax=Lewinella sp. LCG006 TaxID=3231911 RepID=UPI00345FC036
MLKYRASILVCLTLFFSLNSLLSKTLFISASYLNYNQPSYLLLHHQDGSLINCYEIKARDFRRGVQLKYEVLNESPIVLTTMRVEEDNENIGFSNMSFVDIPDGYVLNFEPHITSLKGELGAIEVLANVTNSVHFGQISFVNATSFFKQTQSNEHSLSYRTNLLPKTPLFMAIEAEKASWYYLQHDSILQTQNLLHSLDFDDFHEFTNYHTLTLDEDIYHLQVRLFSEKMRLPINLSFPKVEKNIRIPDPLELKCDKYEMIIDRVDKENNRLVIQHFSGPTFPTNIEPQIKEYSTSFDGDLFQLSADKDFKFYNAVMTLQDSDRKIRSHWMIYGKVERENKFTLPEIPTKIVNKYPFIRTQINPTSYLCWLITADNDYSLSDFSSPFQIMDVNWWLANNSLVIRQSTATTKKE